MCREGDEQRGVVVQRVACGREAADAEPGGERGEGEVVPVAVVCEGGCCGYGAEVRPGGYEFRCFLSYVSVMLQIVREVYGLRSQTQARRDAPPAASPCGNDP